MHWWWNLPSWVTEVASGVALVSVLRFTPKKWLYLGLVATGISLFYETQLDRNGWSAPDFLEREGAIVGAVTILQITIPIGKKHDHR